MQSETKRALIKQYPYKIELHAHSFPASECSEFSPKAAVEAYKEHGFDALVLTNHFTAPSFAGMTPKEAIKKHLEDYEEARKAAQKAGISVLLGTEVRFAEGVNDYLIYGVDAFVLGRVYDYLEKGVAAFRKEVQLTNSVFIQAHPFRAPGTAAEASLLDGVEVFNMHPYHNQRNSLAEIYARENPRLLVTAGSDFHHPQKGNIGRGAIRTRRLPTDSFDLAAILKSRDYILQIGDTILLS